MNAKHPPEPASPWVVSVRAPTVRPAAAYALIGVCMLVFGLQLASTYLLGGDWPVALGMKVNSAIVRGELWRLLTPVFLHGSVLHLVLNMYALWRFGPGLERHYGHGRFLALFALGGFAGNVASFIFTPSPSLGSSTAIFGLFGAEAVFLYQNRKLFGNVAQQALIQMLLLAGYNLAIGFSAGSGIDNWGHIGGLTGGTLFAWFGGPLLRVEGIFPALSMVDQRETREVVLAGIWIGLFFALAAGVAIFLRLGGRVL